MGLRETEATARQFMDQYGVQYPVALDTERRTQRPFNIQGVPTWFILDRGRVVRFQGHGFTAAEILEKLASLEPADPGPTAD